MPDPTVITYQGGSAGDMFAAGLNGVAIDFQDREHVQQPPWSLKLKEAKIISGKMDLGSAIRDSCFDFVTTHLFEPLQSLNFHVISIIILDPEATKLTILRQMKFQRLNIEVKPEETAYRLIKSAADRQNWQKAARCWFAMAWNKWHQDQRRRIDNPLHWSRTLNFDRLYEDDFVDSLSNQKFYTNLDLIKHNHSAWLSKNLNHSLENTLSSMVQKLQKMDWTKQQGLVMYDQPR